jgi:hypothetical protein
MDSGITRTTIGNRRLIASEPEQSSPLVLSPVPVQEGLEAGELAFLSYVE